MVSTSTVQPEAYIAVLLVLGSTHLLNDLLQALIPAIYPIFKDKYALDFVQIGLITLTFQIAGSLLQPLVGHYTDQHPMPYSTAIGMVFTLVGVVSLAFAPSYIMILVSVASIGIGSSFYHPEATRMARYASGNRQGLAQGIFQVGGQIGGALSPCSQLSSSYHGDKRLLPRTTDGAKDKNIKNIKPHRSGKGHGVILLECPNYTLRRGKKNIPNSPYLRAIHS